MHAGVYLEVKGQPFSFFTGVIRQQFQLVKVRYGRDGPQPYQFREPGRLKARKQDYRERKARFTQTQHFFEVREAKAVNSFLGKGARYRKESVAVCSALYHRKDLCARRKETFEGFKVFSYRFKIYFEPKGPADDDFPFTKRCFANIYAFGGCGKEKSGYPTN